MPKPMSSKLPLQHMSTFNASRDLESSSQSLFRERSKIHIVLSITRATLLNHLLNLCKRLTTKSATHNAVVPLARTGRLTAANVIRTILSNACDCTTSSTDQQHVHSNFWGLSSDLRTQLKWRPHRNVDILHLPQRRLSDCRCTPMPHSIASGRVRRQTRPRRLYTCH
eukprot:2105109-Amphidinium_carterae.1